MGEKGLWKPDLFNDPQPGEDYTAKEKWVSHLLDQYKLYVEMADRISQRRATTNTYFLSVNSAILAFVGYLTAKESHESFWMIAVAGVAICWLWKSLISSYRNLNSAKFKIIHAIETRLPIRPYRSEWAFMGEGHDPNLYRPISHIEGGVPWVFISLHAVVFISTFPWYWVSAALKRVWC